MVTKINKLKKRIQISRKLERGKHVKGILSVDPSFFDQRFFGNLFQGQHDISGVCSPGWMMVAIDSRNLKAIFNRVYIPVRTSSSRRKKKGRKEGKGMFARVGKVMIDSCHSGTIFNHVYVPVELKIGETRKNFP